MFALREWVAESCGDRELTTSKRGPSETREVPCRFSLEGRVCLRICDAFSAEVCSVFFCFFFSCLLFIGSLSPIPPRPPAFLTLSVGGEGVRLPQVLPERPGGRPNEFPARNTGFEMHSLPRDHFSPPRASGREGECARENPEGLSALYQGRPRRPRAP